jgi:hypothetical protein
LFLLDFVNSDSFLLIFYFILVIKKWHPLKIKRGHLLMPSPKKQEGTPTNAIP